MLAFMEGSHARFRVDMRGAKASSSPPDWIDQAHRFLAAASTVNYRNLAPALVNVGYALELALKGFLLDQKVADVADLKGISHDLSELLARAEAAGLQKNLLTIEEAGHLDQLFHRHDGSSGKYRAGIYPVEGCFGFAVEPDFFPAVESVVEACATAVCGPRVPTEESRVRRETIENFGYDPGPVAIRRKAGRSQDEPAGDA